VRNKYRIFPRAITALLALATVPMSASYADSVASPPSLAIGSSTSLQYTEGYYMPPERSNSQIYIADSSWQLCSLRGNSQVGSSEGAYVFRSGGNWYLRFWKGTWDMQLWWYCVK
jgi:hypothetical protein